MHQTLLDHIRTELLLRQIQDFSQKDVTNPCIRLLVSLVQHILHYVISKRVLDKNDRVANDLVNQHLPLLGISSVKAPLQNTTSVPMSRDVEDLVNGSLVNELIVVLRP